MRLVVCPAGRELFFKGLDSELRVVKVELGKDHAFGLPESLFALPESASTTAAYNIGPDGKLLVTVQVTEGHAGSFRLVQNWPRLLEQPPR